MVDNLIKKIGKAVYAVYRDTDGDFIIIKTKIKSITINEHQDIYYNLSSFHSYLYKQYIDLKTFNYGFTFLDTYKTNLIFDDVEEAKDALRVYCSQNINELKAIEEE